jgi:hypothetical protein
MLDAVGEVGHNEDSRVGIEAPQIPYAFSCPLVALLLSILRAFLLLHALLSLKNFPIES